MLIDMFNICRYIYEMFNICRYCRPQGPHGKEQTTPK